MKGPGPAVLVFVRAPEAGRVKTRLAAAAGTEAALRLYVALAERAMSAVRGSGAAVRVHHTPSAAGPAVAAWLGAGAAYLPQAGADLGERMRNAFQAAFEAGHAPVVVVGSDLPGISARHLREALGALETRPAVIGPARDGGYWLLGLRAPLDGVFEGVAWSTPRVLTQTLARFRAAGIEPAVLETLSDVDEIGDVPPEMRHLLEA